VQVAGPKREHALFDAVRDLNHPADIDRSVGEGKRLPGVVDDRSRSGYLRDEGPGSRPTLEDAFLSEQSDRPRDGDRTDPVSFDELPTRRQPVPGVQSSDLAAQGIYERLNTAILFYEGTE
jgi:hypothetical protein